MLQFPCVLHNFTASSSWAVRELRLRTNQKRKSRWIRHLHLLNVEMYETLSCQFIRRGHVNVALQVCRKSAVADLSFAIITRSFMLKLEPSSWYPTKIMFAEKNSIIPSPCGIREMAWKSHLPPLVLHLIVLYIHTSKLYKNTALLGPNVYLVGVPKVALRPQLEQIGYICGLCRSADISSSFRDLWDVCWEIKQIHRKAGVTMLCWNWPEVCPHLSVVTLLSCLGCMHSAHKADSQSAFQISVLLTLLLIKKALATRTYIVRGRRKGQSCTLTWWIGYYKCSFSSMSDDWWCFSFFSTE